MYVRIYYDYDNFIDIAYLLSICVCGITPPSGTCIPRFTRYRPLAVGAGARGCDYISSRQQQQCPGILQILPYCKVTKYVLTVSYKTSKF